MKKIYILFAFLVALTMNISAADQAQQPVQPRQGATPQSNMPLAEQGDSAYAKGNYILAEKLYLEALKKDGSSAQLFYNIGNACYRQGNLGKAVLNYERSLKLDPTDQDTRDNLEFVQGKLTDKQIDNGSFMLSLKNQIVEWFTADTWAVIAVVLFAVFIGCMAVYLFSNVVITRKISFFGGSLIFIITLITVLISFAAANRTESNDYAIIMPPAAQLSTSPREARTQSEQAFLLHEGTKVLIVDSISSSAEGKWYEVKVGARDRAWIKASDLQRI